MVILNRHKKSKRSGRRWLKRIDYIFLAFLGVLVVASMLVSHFSPASPSFPLAQASLPPGSPASTTLPASSAYSGGRGDLPASQSTNRNQASALGQTIPTQPQQPAASNDVVDDWFIGNNHDGLLAQTSASFTYNNMQVQAAWGGVVMVANLFLVLFIVINGIRLALGGVGFRYADAVEALPRIVLAFGAANISQYFVEFLINMNNGMCSAILTIAQNSKLEYTGGLPSLFSLLGQFVTIVVSLAALIASQLLNGIPIVGPALAAVAGGVSLDALISSIFLFVLSLMLLVLSLFLFIQLIIRIAQINLLFILAPLGFACWSLPQGAGQQLMRTWLNATFAIIMIQFLQLCSYALGLALFNPLAGLTTTSFPLLTGLGLGGPGLLFKVIVVWFTLRIPGLVQNVTTNTMSEGSRSMSAALSQALGAAQSAVSTVVIAAR